MKFILISVAYWSLAGLIAYVVFLGSNFAGPSGTPTYYFATESVLVMAAMTYLIGIIVDRREKRG